MADVRISQLNLSLPLSGGEFIPITQMGLNGKLQTVYTTPDTIAAYVIGRASSNTDATPIIMPVGATIAFGGDILNPNIVPAGWLVCDGTAVSKTQYSALYVCIGDKFGIATDTQLFKLPDLRYRVVMGYNNTTPTATPTFGNWISVQSLALGQTGGEFNHKLSVDEMPVHDHPLTDPGHSHQSPTWNGLAGPFEVPTSKYGYDYFEQSAPTTSSKTSISIQTTGGNAYHTNMQPFVCMNYIIKY